MTVIVTVLGKDRPGIIATVSGALYEMNANIIDISQTVMREKCFTMIMMADLSEMNVTLDRFKERMDDCARELSMDCLLYTSSVLFLLVTSISNCSGRISYPAWGAESSFRYSLQRGRSALLWALPSFPVMKISIRASAGILPTASFV